MDILLSLVASANIELKRRTSRIISEMAQDEPVQNVIVSKFGIPILVNLLVSSDHDTQVSAVYAISHLSNNKSHRGLIAENEGLGVIVNLLSKLDMDIIDRALWTLANFAMDVQFQGFIIEQGGVDQVISMFDSDLESIKSLSLKTLLILAQNPNNKQSLIKKNIVNILKELQQSTTNRAILLASQKITEFLS